jgi:hypothetical protein
MHSRAKRAVATSALLGIAGAGAASVPAAASSGPVLVGECGAHVHAKKGQAVKLSLSHALGIDGLPSIPLGTARSGTHHYNPKPDITHALDENGLLGGLLGGLTGTVGHVLDAGCPVVVTVKHVVNHAAAPVQHVTGDATKPVRKATGELLGSHHSTHRRTSHAAGRHSAQRSRPARVQARHSPQRSRPARMQARHTGKPAPHQPAAQHAAHRGAHHRKLSPRLSKQLSLPDSAFGAPAGSPRAGIPSSAFDTGPPSDYPGRSAPLRFDLDRVPGFTGLPGSVPKLTLPKLTLPGKHNIHEPGKSGRDAVRTAGDAHALGAQAPRHSGTVSLPPLVAALALAGAVAALIRTWVLRRPA